MSTRRADLMELARADERYALEAYEFLCHALAFTQKTLGKTRAAKGADDQACHVRGQDLLDGIRQFAIEQFGMMACVVFRVWGVESTSDFGKMVYTLIDAGLWHKSPEDRLEDFDDYYDFEKVFIKNYRIEWDEI